MPLLCVLRLQDCKTRAGRCSSIGCHSSHDADYIPRLHAILQTLACTHRITALQL
jgi:hypothetical protein